MEKRRQLARPRTKTFPYHHTFYYPLPLPPLQPPPAPFKDSPMVPLKAKYLPPGSHVGNLGKNN